MTFNDRNEDGFLRGDEGDEFQIGGTTYIIGQVYNGDQVRVDGQWYETVTFYGTGPGDNFAAVTLPIIDGTLGAAFPGSTDSTIYILEPNEFSLPLDEIPCFTSGTMIATDRGEVAVQDLIVGDLVATRDAGMQPVRWIGQRHLGPQVLQHQPQLRPVRIRAGALGEGLPTSDLIVSPQHRVLVRSSIAQRLFGTDEVLVAAKQLLSIEGIEIDHDMTDVTYVHILFDDHQVILSNGAASESLYTGMQALRSVGPAARAEIFALFPQLRDPDAHGRAPGARMLLTGRQGRKLAERHAKNRKPLMA